MDSPVSLRSYRGGTPLNPLQCIVPQPMAYRQGFIEESEQFSEDNREEQRLHLKLKEHLKVEIEKSCRDMEKMLRVEREQYRPTSINYTLRREFDRI